MTILASMMPRNLLNANLDSTAAVSTDDNSESGMLSALYASRGAAGLPAAPASAGLPTNAALLNSLLAEEQRRQALFLAAQPGGDRLTRALLLQRNAEQQALLGAGLLPSSLPGIDASCLGVGGLGLLGMSGLANPFLAQAGLLSGAGVAAAAAQQSGASQLLGGHSQGSAADAAALPQDEKTGRKGRTGTFPQKLHQMLSDLEKEEGGTEIACFLPHGRAFAIHKPKEFVKQTMPKYFRMSRFSSFQRQLNLYDFQRITEGPDKGAYFHELFVKGRPTLSTRIKRNKIKGVTGPGASPAVGALGRPWLQPQLGAGAVSAHSVLGAQGLSAAQGLTAASLGLTPAAQMAAAANPPASLLLSSLVLGGGAFAGAPEPSVARMTSTGSKSSTNPTDNQN